MILDEEMTDAYKMSEAPADFKSKAPDQLPHRVAAVNGNEYCIMWDEFVTIVEFCHQYCKGKYTVGQVHVYFELESDLAVFKIGYV